MAKPWNEPTLDNPSSVSAEGETLGFDGGESVLPPGLATLPEVPGYEIQGELGRGGMGVVYKARHLVLNRDVALKMILAGSQAGAVTLVRFRQEAETIANLDHPNIVQVHEVGSFEGQSYLALEYVGGGDLACKTAGVPQPPRDSAQLVEILATALHHAHVRGILHRDLKPANVLLTIDGVPKIADFGLARRIGDTTGLTVTHAILGTPSYIAPEQAAANKDIGPAVDIYGLGAILYELLSGRPPFQGANAVEILRRVMEDLPVSLRRLRSDCPRDLDVICLKCLEKDPAKRYPTAAALADDLHRYLADEPILARPVGRLHQMGRLARRHPGVTALLGLTALLLLVIAIGGVGLSLRLNTALGQSEANRHQAEGDRDTARRAEAQGKEKLYQSLVSEARAKRFSRRVGQRQGTLEAIRQAVALGRELDKPAATFDELRNLAIAALALPDLRPAPEWISDPVEKGWSSSYQDVEPRFRLQALTNTGGAVSLRRVGTGPDDAGEIARLPGFGVEAVPVWSPDGRLLSVWHWNHRRVQVWRTDGPTPAVVVDEQGVCEAFGFSPSSGQFVTVGDGSLRVYDLPDGRQTKSFPVATDAWEEVAYHPTLPRVAVPKAGGGVMIVDLTTGKDVGQLRTGTVRSHIVWHPDGDLLAVTTATHVQIWDVPRKRLNWELEHRGGGLKIAINPVGDLLLSRSWAGRMKFWNPHTGREVLQTIGGFGRFGSSDRLGTTYADAWQGKDAGPLTQIVVGREYSTLVAGAGRTTPVRDYGDCSIHPDGRLLAVGTQQGISLMDLAIGGEREFLPFVGLVVLFEPSGALLVNTTSGLLRWPVRSDPALAHHYRVGPPERVATIVQPFNAHVARSRDGTVLAGSNPHATGVQAVGAYVWHRDRPREAIPLQPHTDCRSIAISPNGTLVATGSYSGHGLKVWDASSGKLIREFLPDTQGTHPFFSPDGRWLMNRSGESWRIDDWSEGPQRVGGSDVAFAPDMRLAAWGGKKGVIPLDDPETGRELARLEDPNHDGLNALKFSHDGTRLIGTTTDSFCVRVWDLRKIRAGLAELGLDWDAPPYPPEPVAPHAVPLQVELIWAEKPPAPPEPPGLADNNQAWRLVTGPSTGWDPAQALILIRRAVEREPGNGTYLNTLGVVLYRNGRFKEAVAALDKSLAASRGKHDGFDLFFLAMCHKKIGDEVEAKDCFDRAVKWIGDQKNLSKAHLEDLKAFRAEAEALLVSVKEPKP